MRKFLSICALVLVSGCGELDLPFAGGPAGNGDIQQETRAVNRSFNTLDIDSPLHVRYIQSEATPTITVEADSNILESIRTDVSNDRLHVYFDRAIKYANQAFIEIHGPVVNRVSITQAAELELLAVQHSGKMVIDLSDAAFLRFEGDARQLSLSMVSNARGSFKGSETSGPLDLEELTLRLDGGSEIELEGQTDRSDVFISGGARFKGETFLSRFAEFEANHSARITLSVSETLRARLENGSRLYYFGEPQIELSAENAAFLFKGSKNEQEESPSLEP